MTDNFTLESFSEHADTDFRMHYGQSQTADLKLVSVNDLDSTPPSPVSRPPVPGPPSPVAYG